MFDGRRLYIVHPVTTQDRATDRCYAAKHIRFRKLEQKEKVILTILPHHTMPQVVEEINLLKKFSNPHIIRFIEAFENPGEVNLIIEYLILIIIPIFILFLFLIRILILEVILIMEYLDGGELFERVADDDFNLTESDCCLFMRQICRGVQYLHDHNIVHLDLKVMMQMGIGGMVVVRLNSRGPQQYGLQ